MTASRREIQQPPMVVEIQLAVARDYGIAVEDLRGRSRQRRYVEPRQVAMYLARELRKLPVCQIGRLFDRDHGTVLHAWDTVADRCSRNRDFAQRVARLRDALDVPGEAKPLLGVFEDLLTSAEKAMRARCDELRQRFIVAAARDPHAALATLTDAVNQLGGNEHA